MRDPLTDPRPGDVVRPPKGRERHVDRRDGDDISYWCPTATGEPGKLRVTWLWHWRDWCCKSKVVFVKRGN